MSTLKDLIDKRVDNKGRSLSEREEIRDIEAKVNEEARANWDDPSWRREMAGVLTESILEGFELNSFFDQMVEVRRVGFEDRVILEEETGLKVFYIAKGGHIEASALVSEKMEIPRDTMGFHVYEFEDHLLSGFAKTISTMRNQAVRRLDWGVQKHLRNLITAAVGVGHASYITGAGLDQTALNSAIREVRDESTTGEVSIWGRSAMVDQIMDFPGFADEALEEIRKRGRLGTYRGASIISTSNYKDEVGASFVPANEMYVIGSDAGLFAMYGGLLSKEYNELDNWYWHYIGRQDMGGTLHRPERVRRVVDTAITP